jgi:TonB family protein
MKPNFAVVLLTLGLASTCWSKIAQKKSAPPECTKIIRVHGSVPKGPFKALPGESYKQAPVIKFEIQEDGTVSNTTVTRGSGVAYIDMKILAPVSRWKFKPWPAGCGVIETEMSVDIDFR